MLRMSGGCRQEMPLPNQGVDSVVVRGVASALVKMAVMTRWYRPAIAEWKPVRTYSDRPWPLLERGIAVVVVGCLEGLWVGRGQLWELG